MHSSNKIVFEDDWEHVEDGAPSGSTGQVITDPASLELIDFDPNLLAPEEERMQEACRSGDLTEVQSIYESYWLDLPADERNPRNSLGAVGLCEAITRDDRVVADYLLSNGTPMLPVHFEMATDHRARSILQLYIDRNFDINTYLSRINPPALSLTFQDTELMMWFLLNGANPNARCGLDKTPLSIAVRDAPFEVIRTLFDHGGSIQHGHLLHFAAFRHFPDRLDVVRYLLDKGAPLNNVMYENDPESYVQEWVSGLGTPLHYAAAEGYLDVVDLLLSRGADPLIKNSQGELAIDKAEYHGRREVIERLRPLS